MEDGKNTPRNMNNYSLTNSSLEIVHFRNKQNSKKYEFKKAKTYPNIVYPEILSIV